MNIRVIPRLDIKGPNLVKGVHLEGLRVLGQPGDFAYKYYQDGADELIYVDLVASLYGRSSLLEIVKSTARRIFIPLTAGGGIRTLDDIRAMLRAGADEVCINTALFETPELITEGSRVFGSQCMVLNIEARKEPDGSWVCMHTNARESSGREVVDWAREMVDRGAGEILLTSVDYEGTGRGFDLDLIQTVSDAVNVPVIANGGAGNSEHLNQAARAVGTGGVSASSIFHYHRLEELSDAMLHDGEGNTSYIELSRSKTTSFLNGRIKAMSVSEAKEQLAEKGIECRKHSPVAVTPGTTGNGIVCVVDYGMGNLFNLARSLTNLGVEYFFTSSPDDVASADKIVIPGVGAYGDAMQRLDALGLSEAIRERVRAGVPVLGICLGMQLLFSRSMEFGENEGLGLLPGTVELLWGPDERQERAKLPHIGWNRLCLNNAISWASSELEEFPVGGPAYFVHSYVCIPENPEHVLATSEYGGVDFCSVVKKGSVCGCQFHPELSGEYGQLILKNFCFNSGY